jgi:hypothetical protein
MSGVVVSLVAEVLLAAVSRTHSTAQRLGLDFTYINSPLATVVPSTLDRPQAANTALCKGDSARS